MENPLLRFDDTGHLQAGVHACSWSNLQELTFTNLYRERLGRKLLEFLSWPRQMGYYRAVYIGGGFISNRPFPRDIDVILEMAYPFGPEAFKAMEPFFAKGLNVIHATYSVHLHFWMEGAPPALSDYRSFFQYQKPLRADYFPSTKKGIIRMSLDLEEIGIEINSLTRRSSTTTSRKYG